ncbi:hypothetical protein C2E21_7246 [Chlorella sorokiniana]|uniref:Uncharacterized protein n=1 Tax=Chlorella sorokiniana TaxID=3076 RepID=A0A2P6THK3_CHLSO|nr:hypothetical protein C2E21_7246 [Chlorella sorokiniana]|eukprot:PRW33771.1 hypothetical protein C2E21_7246 [Chlorella sorokiniana]
MPLDEYVSALAAAWEAGCCTAAERLVPALLRRDERVLDAALALHTAAQLAAVQQPLPLYHAAALADWPEAVAALAAAGVPPSSADALVRVPDGSLLACTLAHASVDYTKEAGNWYSAAARLGNCYSAVGMAAACGHVQSTATLLAIGASATAGRELGALPASRAAALHGRMAAVQGLLALLAAAGGQMTPQEVADSLRHTSTTCPANPVLLRQLIEQRASLDGLSDTELRAVTDTARYCCCTQIVELLPPAFAADFLPTAAPQQDPAFLLRLLGLLGRPLPCPTSTQQMALTHALNVRQHRSVAALLAAGVQPTAAHISTAICSCEPGVLRALLAAAHPPEPQLPAGTIDVRSPQFVPQLPSFVHQALLLAAQGSQLGTPVSRLQVVEALVAAGYRLHTYHDVTVRITNGWEARYKTFDPLAHDPSVLASKDKRYLELAISHPAWTPSTHKLFPPAFRRACRALLLAAHRSTAMHLGRAQAYCAAGLQPPVHLGSLPTDVLLLVLQHAAYPLSLFVALPDCMPPAAKPAPRARQLVKARRPSAKHLLDAMPAPCSVLAALGAAPAFPGAAPAAPAFGSSVAAAAARACDSSLAATAAQPAGVAADVFDVVAAFKAAVNGGSAASGSGSGSGSASAAAAGPASSDSAGSQALALPTTEQLSQGLAALSFSTHSGPFVFGGSG